jgi:carbamate kinase
MRIAAALGGNALLRRGQAAEASTQLRNIAEAADALAPLAAGNDLLITHGNGPQVGLLMLQAEAYRDIAPYPLDILDAESEGMIGYLIDQELANRLPGRQTATLLTRVEVADDDPAFEHPDKPVGAVYDAATGARIAGERGWTMIADGGGKRRAVASPEPLNVLESETIRLLLDAGIVVICAGGGGIPVCRRAGGGHAGTAAVIDKDATTALLAAELAADSLLLLTDVAGVYLDWQTPGSRLVRQAHPDALDAYAFAAGSMAPKVAAACRFARETGKPAFIGDLGAADAVLRGGVGTRIATDVDGIDFD